MHGPGRRSPTIRSDFLLLENRMACACTLRDGKSSRRFRVGQTVSLKIINATAVITALTDEVVPRYVVRTLSMERTMVDLVVSGSEIDAEDPMSDDSTPEGSCLISWESNARGDLTSTCGRFEIRHVNGTFDATDLRELDASGPFALQADAIAWCEDQLSPQPKTGLLDIPHPELIWGPADSHGGTLTQCRRFAILVDAAGRYVATDHKHSVDSSPFWRIDGAKQWCSARAGVPFILPIVSGLKWFETGAGIVTEDGRFMIHCDGREGPRYHAVDTYLETSLRYSSPGSLDEVKAWCEERSKFCVAKTADSEELIPESELPF